MHRLIQDHLEEVLSESSISRSAAAHLVAGHLAACTECREEISALRQQRTMLHALRAPSNELEETLAPRAGFYARVMERIEAQRPVSIYQLFFESAFGRRLAIGSMAMVLLFSVYLVSSERYAQQPVTIRMALLPNDLSEGAGISTSKAGLPDKDAVLLNLVTYREQ